jgi:DNA-binding FadR family transcriptional regulator
VETLAPIARTSVTDQVVTRLIGLIVDEGLKAGEKLPSERELTARLGVGRSSLREAIKTLEAIGAVEVSVGEGMFVGRGQTSLLAKPLAWGLLMSEASAREVVDARRVVESELAALAADAATAEDVAEIAARFETMRASLGHAELYSQADLEFHLAVARAAHNAVLYHFVDTIRHLVRVWVVQNYTDFTPEERVRAHDEHAPIVAAIAAHDAAAARRAMAAHLHVAGTRLLAVVAGRTEQPRGR